MLGGKGAVTGGLIGKQQIRSKAAVGGAPELAINYLAWAEIADFWEPERWHDGLVGKDDDKCELDLSPFVPLFSV
jgi:hypothetical protein